MVRRITPEQSAPRKGFIRWTTRGRQRFFLFAAGVVWPQQVSVAYRQGGCEDGRSKRKDVTDIPPLPLLKAQWRLPIVLRDDENLLLAPMESEARWSPLVEKGGAYVQLCRWKRRSWGSILSSREPARYALLQDTGPMGSVRAAPSAQKARWTYDGTRPAQPSLSLRAINGTQGEPLTSTRSKISQCRQM